MSSLAPSRPLTDTVIDRAAAVLVAVALGGCGGAAPKLAPETAADRANLPEDLTIDLATATVAGRWFVPDAAPRPQLPAVRPRKKLSLDRQRAVWKKLAADPRAVAARKELEAQVLATMLIDALRERGADASAGAPLRAEARAALATAHAATGGKAAQITLELAAGLALADRDAAGAAPYLDELIARFPGTPTEAVARAQLGFAALVAGNDAAAAAQVAGREPDPAAPELAYVIAWVRFRSGEGAGAAQAIKTAATGWRDPDSRAAVLRDYVLMTARGQVPAFGAADALEALVPDVASRSAALLDLAGAFELAGRASDAILVLDAMVRQLGAALPAPELVTLRRDQAELAAKAGQVRELGPRWGAVQAALQRCPTCAADLRRSLGVELARRAYELHTIYVTSGDDDAKAAALALYALHAGLDGADDAPEVATHARELEHAQRPDDGGQYADAVRGPLTLRVPEVIACYEDQLQRARTLGGALIVRLEVDRRGQVTGVATEPPGGDDGLAAVARCVEARARTWWLPARTRPGTARIALPFLLTTAR